VRSKRGMIRYRSPVGDRLDKREAVYGSTIIVGIVLMAIFPSKFWWAVATTFCG